MSQLLTPQDFSLKYHISRAVITRCKQRGAPVQYYGTSGRRYWIDEVPFLAWMNEQGQKDQDGEKEEWKPAPASLLEMRAARHRLVQGM